MNPKQTFTSTWIVLACLLAGTVRAETERFSVNWTLLDPCFAPDQVVECEADVWRASSTKREVTRARGTCTCDVTGEEWAVWGRSTITKVGGNGLYQTGRIYFHNRDSGLTLQVHWRDQDGDLFGKVTKFECEPANR